MVDDYNRLMALGRKLRGEGRREEAESAFEAALATAYRRPDGLEWEAGEPKGWAQGLAQGHDGPVVLRPEVQPRLMIRGPLAVTSAMFASFGLVRIQFPAWAPPLRHDLEPAAMLAIWLSAIALGLFALMPASA
jgi:hypothetical protein